MNPAGVFFWTIITGVFDFVATAFLKGGLNPRNRLVRQKAWRKYDPTASWSKTNKAWKIDKGLFITDKNKALRGRTWELISRFVWQSPQTLLGYLATGIHNLLGGVRRIDYYGGATIAESYSENWGAIALGNYINGSEGITARTEDSLFQHEYGHYLQSQASGWFYLSKYGIPSVLSKKGANHNLHPAEQDANIRAFKYFNKHIDGYAGWVHDRNYSNPINGYDPGLPYDAQVNQAALKDGMLRLAWYDYLLGPQILLPGLLNTVIQNGRY